MRACSPKLVIWAISEPAFGVNNLMLEARRRGVKREQLGVCVLSVLTGEGTGGCVGV